MMRTTSVAVSVNEIYQEPVRWGARDDDLAMFVDGVIFVQKNSSKRIGENKGWLREADAVFLSNRSIFAFVPFEDCRHACLPTAYETGALRKGHRSQAARRRSIWEGNWLRVWRVASPRNHPSSDQHLQPAKKVGRPRAKHSSPDYVQMSVYVHKDIRTKVKVRLFQSGGEFSALVESLLREWLEGQT